MISIDIKPHTDDYIYIYTQRNTTRYNTAIFLLTNFNEHNI